MAECGPPIPASVAVLSGVDPRTGVAVREPDLPRTLRRRGGADRGRLADDRARRQRGLRPPRLGRGRRAAPPDPDRRPAAAPRHRGPRALPRRVVAPRRVRPDRGHDPDRDVRERRDGQPGPRRPRRRRRRPLAAVHAPAATGGSSRRRRRARSCSSRARRSSRCPRAAAATARRASATRSACAGTSPRAGSAPSGPARSTGSRYEAGRQGRLRDGRRRRARRLDLRGARARGRRRSSPVDVHGDALHLDIGTDAGNRAMVEAALERHGRLDVLVLNAGAQHVAPIPESRGERVGPALRRDGEGPVAGDEARVAARRAAGRPGRRHRLRVELHRRAVQGRVRGGEARRARPRARRGARGRPAGDDGERRRARLDADAHGREPARGADAPARPVARAR